MEVKEVLRLASIFTDQKELLEDEYFLQTLPQDYEPSLERKGKIEALLECLNLVFGEVTTDYLPLTFKEKVSFNQNKAMFSDFSKVVTKIISLKNPLGKDIRFKLFPSFIEARTSQAEVVYNFESEKLLLSSKIELFGQRFPARVFAFGVAMEHFFLQAQSTEALIWENRYKNSLLGLVRNKHNIVLPARRWI